MKCQFYVVRDGHSVGPFYAASMRGALGHIPTILEREDRWLGEVYQLRYATERIREETRKLKRQAQRLADRNAHSVRMIEAMRAQILRQREENAKMSAAIALFNPRTRGSA